MLEHRRVWLQQDVNSRDRSLLEREDLFPIILHADYGRNVVVGMLIKGRREGDQFDVRQSTGRTVGELAYRIVVQHEQFKPCAAAALRVFQHLLIAVGISERGDGTAANVPA